MSDKTQKLGAFLREVSNWTWEDFCLAEKDPKYTTNQALIFAVVRACAMEEMNAIKLALNRIDGKLKTPIRIEMPKVFYLFPNAKFEDNQKAPRVKTLVDSQNNSTEVEDSIIAYESLDSEPKPEIDLPSLSLRQTVAAMSDEPRQIPEAVIKFATMIQQWIKHGGPKPSNNPLVKSVVAAHLLSLAQRRDINALTEVFDQIDGKLVETIQVLGEDMFITIYSLTAPDGAYLNDDGVIQLEAVQAQNMWAEKLTNKNGG